MPAVELTVILPVKNIEVEISGVLREIFGQTKKVPCELIVVDMGSTDHTVLEAVRFLKEERLNGFVLQNGDTGVSAALNSGLQKSGGKYVTFVFARRLYNDFIESYYETALKTDADIVFGCATLETVKNAERRFLSRTSQKKTGSELVLECLNGVLQIDISALMLRRKFLLDERLFFTEECRHGYAEEFVFRCLLAAGAVAQSPVLLRRDRIYELKRGKKKSIGRDIFQHVEAVIRVKNIAAALQKPNRELLTVLEQEKLPRTVLEGIDVMLREGNGYNTVRGGLRISGYDKLLRVGRKTPYSLRQRVFLWRTFPWMYHPEQGKREN